MDRHFALPITLAAALHAGLLFWKSTPTPVTLPDKVAVPSDPFKNFQEVILAPPESSEEKTEPAKRNSDDTRVVTPEPVPAEPRDPVVTVVVPAVSPTKPDHPITVIGDPPGAKEGSTLGIGIKPGGIIDGIYLDSPPRTRLQVAPQYPHAERTLGMPGEVLVEFTVDESGVVLSPRVVRSSNRAFDEPTLRAVAKWRFEPGRRYGRVVSFRMAVPIVFKLDND